MFRGAILGENSAIYDQVLERYVADRVTKEVDNVVDVVEKRVTDATLTTIDNVDMPKVDMVV